MHPNSAPFSEDGAQDKPHGRHHSVHSSEGGEEEGARREGVTHMDRRRYLMEGDPQGEGRLEEGEEAGRGEPPMGNSGAQPRGGSDPAASHPSPLAPLGRYPSAQLLQQQQQPQGSVEGGGMVRRDSVASTVSMGTVDDRDILRTAKPSTIVYNNFQPELKVWEFRRVRGRV
jgi:hypothetical protein